MNNIIRKERIIMKISDCCDLEKELKDRFGNTVGNIIKKSSPQFLIDNITTFIKLVISDLEVKLTLDSEKIRKVIQDKIGGTTIINFPNGNINTIEIAQALKSKAGELIIKEK